LAYSVRIAGALLIPTFQGVFCRAVDHFQVHRSVPKLILHGFFKGGLSYVKMRPRYPPARTSAACAEFRRAIVWLVGSRLAGTLLAQALLVPSAMLIVFVARAV
jgi:hypothetical protein